MSAPPSGGGATSRPPRYRPYTGRSTVASVRIFRKACRKSSAPARQRALLCSSRMPRDWDAATYERVSGPQTRWGQAVLDRLPLEGDERVLDAGCGTGKVTAMLLERLPRGRVVALDGSPSMIEEARRRFAGDGRVELV